MSTGRSGDFKAKLRFWLPLFAAFVVQAASADAYKCRLTNGQIEISNLPCPIGSGTVSVRPDEHVSEAARRQAEEEVDRMRAYAEKQEAAQRKTETAERRERNEAKQSVDSRQVARNYTSAEECRHDIDQMALDASQRIGLETECQSINGPQTVYLPLYMPIPAVRPVRGETQAPTKTPAPPAPKISSTQIAK